MSVVNSHGYRIILCILCMTSAEMVMKKIISTVTLKTQHSSKLSVGKHCCLVDHIYGDVLYGASTRSFERGERGTGPEQAYQQGNTIYSESCH